MRDNRKYKEPMIRCKKTFKRDLLKLKQIMGTQKANFVNRKESLSKNKIVLHKSYDTALNIIRELMEEVETLEKIK